MVTMLFASKIVKGREVAEISQYVRILRKQGKHHEAIAMILRQSSDIKPFLYK